MFVKVMLHSKPAIPLLSVPEEAVRPGNVVWAVRDDKLARFDLPAARVMHGAVVVAPQVTTLALGDRVVVSPLPAAVEGMSVRTRTTEPAAPIAETADPPPQPQTASEAAA